MSPGPAPKHPEARRRRNFPAGGEWIDLQPLDKPVLGPLPKRTKSEGGAWSARAKATWAAWRRDPATREWTAADEAVAIETLHLLDASVREPKAALASEIRLRQDGLGLTAKGKRNLRWRVIEADEEPEPAEPPKAPKLKVRDDG
jgi:hypothetical protein